MTGAHLNTVCCSHCPLWDTHMHTLKCTLQWHFYCHVRCSSAYTHAVKIKHKHQHTHCFTQIWAKTEGEKKDTLFIIYNMTLSRAHAPSHTSTGLGGKHEVLHIKTHIHTPVLCWRPHCPQRLRKVPRGVHNPDAHSNMIISIWCLRWGHIGIVTSWSHHQ